jgi:hypothetical protein
LFNRVNSHHWVTVDPEHVQKDLTIGIRREQTPQHRCTARDERTTGWPYV